MPTKVLMPQMGESIFEGTVTKWLKKVGEMGIRTSPLVRRLAKEHSVDLRQLTGSGAGGRISKTDILGAIEKGVPAARPGAPAAVELGLAVPRERLYFGRYTVEPMTGMRRSIAEHMVASKRTSPHVYSVDEVDMTPIARLR